MNEDQLLQPIQVDEWHGKQVGQLPLTLREKLLKLFSATDFVRVINIDTEPFTWQYMPSQKEHISFDTTTSTVPMKSTFREPPEVYQLAPGQSAIIIGASAFLMIESLIKHMISEEAVSRDGGTRILPGARSRKFAYSDDVKQHELIERIYLGKHMPGMNIPSKPAESTSTIENDLGITNEDAPKVTKYPIRTPGRKPRGAVA